MSELIQIETDQLPPETPTVCGNCGHRALISQLDEPVGAVLTPGDPVPAGRCTECEEQALCYIDSAIANLESSHCETLADAATNLLIVTLRAQIYWLQEPDIREPIKRALWQQVQAARKGPVTVNVEGTTYRLPERLRGAPLTALTKEAEWLTADGQWCAVAEDNPVLGIVMQLLSLKRAGHSL